MVIYAPKVKENNILVFDIEFDGLKLVQFAGFLFHKVKQNIYQLSGTCTQYVNVDKVTYPFAQYTGINKTFLLSNGTNLESVAQVILDDFLGDISLDDLLIVSHGLKNDRKILLENKINLTYNEKSLKQIAGFCTFTNAKRILCRGDRLKLDDLAEESGFYLGPFAHDAYHDALATLSVFCYLKKMEEQGELQ